MAGTLIAPTVPLPDRPAHSEHPDHPYLPHIPTEDELPYSDGIPLESDWHVLQMILLRLALTRHWAGREFFVGGDMFVYYSEKRVFNADFRGPDLFVVLDVPVRRRKSWVVWQEGKAPDLIIELMSPSTRELDRTLKKAVYQNELRVPEYVWFDPEFGELAGFSLQRGVYEPILPDPRGRICLPLLDLALVKWSGVFEGIEASWIRWETLDGILLPTPTEDAEQAGREAAEARSQAAEARRQLAAARQERTDAERLADEERLRAERMAARLRALGVDPEE
jgi:Uma2 family endonuclease